MGDPMEIIETEPIFCKVIALENYGRPRESIYSCETAIVTLSVICGIIKQDWLITN